MRLWKARSTAGTRSARALATSPSTLHMYSPHARLHSPRILTPPRLPSFHRLRLSGLPTLIHSNNPWHNLLRWRNPDASLLLSSHPGSSCICTPALTGVSLLAKKAGLSDQYGSGYASRNII